MLSHVNGRIHEGKIAIITGSSRGIGAAIARNLAQKGANLVLTYQQESSDAAADLLVEEFFTTYSVRAVKCRADIATCEGVESIVSACATLCAPSEPLQIDIVVNNAACFSSLPLEKIDPKDFAHTYETNVLGPILLTQRCLPYLPPDRSGRIVNISSVATKVNPAGSTLHAGTKAALESMTRTWARELADSCTVNAVSTGFTMTDMLRDASDEVRNGMKIYNSFTPLSKIQSHDSAKQIEVAEKQGGRAGYPEEVAGIVGIICSPESSWMTGCLLGANGGLTMIA